MTSLLGKLRPCPIRQWRNNICWSYRMHSADATDRSDPPEKHLLSYKIRGHTAPNNPNGVIATTIAKDDESSFTMFTDLPDRMGGHESAPQPMEWLLVAFVGCIQSTAHFVARHYWSDEKKKLITLQRLQFLDITATRDSRGSTSLPIVDTEHHKVDDSLPPSRVQQLTGTIRVFFKTPTENDAQERAECLRVLQEQTERRCPVSNTIAASGCRMDVIWEDAGPLPAPKFDWD